MTQSSHLGGWRPPSSALSRMSPALILLAALMLALFAGLLAAVLPWFLVVPLALLPIMAAVAMLMPELGVAALLAAIFGAIPPMLLPNLPVGGGSVRPEDLGILAFLFLLFFKNFGRVQQRIQPFAKYFWPLILVGLAVVLSAAHSYFYLRTPARDVLNEIRPYMYWLLLPLLPLAVDEGQGMRRFMWFLLGLALLLALGMSIQSFAGVQIFQRGSFRDVYTVNDAAEGVIRSTSPGMFVMAGALIYLVASFVTGSRYSKALMALAGIVLGLGILVGFGRGLWLSVVLGLLVLALIANFGRYIAFSLVSLIMAGVVLAAIGFVKPTYLSAAADRMLSVAPELSHGSSFGRRILEANYAIPRVVESPWLGAGLGAPYKPPTPESRGWDGETRYIHNSYINIATKLGLPGLALMTWLVVTILWRAWSAFRSADRHRALLFAVFWTMVTVTVFTSITQPNLASTSGVATICVAIFLIERLRQEAPTQPDAGRARGRR